MWLRARGEKSVFGLCASSRQAGVDEDGGDDAEDGSNDVGGRGRMHDPDGIDRVE